MNLKSQSHSIRSIQSNGFTLIEVLIGLAILSIALATGIKAISQSAQTQSELQERYLALWSANNALNEMVFRQEWPEEGSQMFPCPQLNHLFVCKKAVFATPNPLFRRVEISVYAGSLESQDQPTGVRLALLVTVLNNPSVGIL